MLRFPSSQLELGHNYLGAKAYIGDNGKENRNYRDCRSDIKFRVHLEDLTKYKIIL